MALIENLLQSRGVIRTTYDASARTATVYYANGSIDYVYGGANGLAGVQWGDYSAVISSPNPLYAVQTNLTSKYKTSSGHR